MNALFDSDVLIDFLLGEGRARVEIGKYSHRLISMISWIEVMIGAETAEEEMRCREFLASFKIVMLDQAIAEEAVRLRKTHSVKLPDAIIWASARVHEALLVTRNRKDFPKSDPFIRFPYG